MADGWTSNMLVMRFFSVFEQTENPLEKLVEVAYLLYINSAVFHNGTNRKITDKIYYYFFGLPLGFLIYLQPVFLLFFLFFFCIFTLNSRRIFKPWQNEFLRLTNSCFIGIF